MVSSTSCRSTALIAAVSTVLAVLMGCGGALPDYSIDLNSTHIDYNLFPREDYLDYEQEKDVEKKKDEAEWVFSTQKSYEVAGYVSDSFDPGQPPMNVFARTLGLVWDKTAIEIVMQPDRSKTSEEANRILSGG